MRMTLRCVTARANTSSCLKRCRTLECPASSGRTTFSATRRSISRESPEVETGASTRVALDHPGSAGKWVIVASLCPREAPQEEQRDAPGAFLRWQSGHSTASVGEPIALVYEDRTSGAIEFMGGGSAGIYFEDEKSCLPACSVSPLIRSGPRRSGNCRPHQGRGIRTLEGDGNPPQPERRAWPAAHRIAGIR